MKQAEKAANKELILLYEKSAEHYKIAILLLKYLILRPCDPCETLQRDVCFIFYLF